MAWKSIAALFVLAIVACASGGPDDRTAQIPIAHGDLAEIMERGELRILLPRRQTDPRLPRKGLTLNFERELAFSYARELGVEPVEIHVDSRDRLIPDLLAGRGDVIAAHLTATAERKESVAFTVPVAVVREQLVARADDPVSSLADLNERHIALRASSSFWGTVEKLREHRPAIEIEEVEEDVDTEEIIHRVAVGALDLTVADSNLVEACLEYRNDIRAALDLTRERPIGLAVRPNSPNLLEDLNQFLTEAQLTDRSDGIHLEDFPEIKQRRVLRMLTRNNAATYFLWRGELMGFEYDLVGEFARRNGLRLEVIVPPVGEDLLPWLREGRGDVVAASLTPTEERREGGVEFTRPYHYVSQVIVTRADDDELQTPQQLAGRSIHVRPSSAYRDTLVALRDTGIDFEIVAAPEEMETEEIIARVADGEFDLTLSDSHILEIELNWRDDVKPAFALSESEPLAWAVRGDNPELKAALDSFIRQEYRGLYYNVIYEKYFKNSGKIRTFQQERDNAAVGLSPYDDIVKKYAAEYGFDWRLIVSMMYQESRFDPGAQSFAGAGGLMQLLPNTAGELGFDDILDPENGIHAGVKYLDWVRDRFEPDLAVPDRMWFSLAAYNAGAGHVRDARRLAAKQGLNPNRWFGNVERAMLLLSRPQYAQEARHGYCRSHEPVRYVREVRSRYNAYVESIDSYQTF
jgi:membrane-bound lytic murein transglycosylase F